MGVDALLLERVAPLLMVFGTGPSWSGNLNKVGKKLFGALFLGAFAPNKQPKRHETKPGTMWLWNTSIAGEHWGATGILPNGKRLSYDSYGRNNSLIKDRKHMKKKDFQLWTESDEEQHKKSAVCGPLSLAWLTIFHEKPELAKAV